jgi:hypothetical protein
MASEDRHPILADTRRGIVVGIKALIATVLISAGAVLITGVESSDEPALRPQDQSVSAPVGTRTIDIPDGVTHQDPGEKHNE